MRSLGRRVGDKHSLSTIVMDLSRCSFVCSRKVMFRVAVGVDAASWLGVAASAMAAAGRRKTQGLASDVIEGRRHAAHGQTRALGASLR
jgi:hypothetical protein